MMAQVYEVTAVDAFFNKTRPVEFVVTAEGTTRTGGYTNPRLERVIYVTVPVDGIQDYDFVATPPSGVSTDQITPIAAEDIWEDPPSWVRGARVRSETNSMERVVSKTSAGQEAGA
jgi:hypothetical protein